MIVLPMVSLLTIVLMLVGGEAMARLFWPMQTGISCALHTPQGERFRPNCMALTKAPDGPWVENRFNECGYRSARSCGPKSAGQLRVVVLGSSISRGALVPYQDSFAARAAASLTARCNVVVDIQNLGTDTTDYALLATRLPETLALAPDAVVLLIGPHDIAHLRDAGDSAAGPDNHTIPAMLRVSRLFVIGQSYLYRDPAIEIRAFLYNRSAASNYLEAPLPTSWQARLRDAAALLTPIADTLRRNRISFLLVYVPERAQAAMAIPQFAPLAAQAHVDPFALPRALAQIASAGGQTFMDMVPAFAAAADFNALYYRTDGHPSAGGHALIADELVSALLRQDSFARCRRPAQ